MPIPLGILAVAGAGAAGAASSFDLLETTVLGSLTSSVTFSNLNTYSDYKHLQLRILARSTSSGGSDRTMRIRFNNDSGASAYVPWHDLAGDGSSVTSGYAGAAGDAIYLRGQFSRSSDTANNFGAAVVDILDFSSTSKNKTTRSLGGFADSARWISVTSGLWLNTAAITSIRLDLLTENNMAIGSRFSLYGVK